MAQGTAGVGGLAVVLITGCTTAPWATAEAADAPLTRSAIASGLTPTEDSEVTASDRRANDYFGSAVAGAGDLNGDGYDDVVVGATSGGTGHQGAAYLYYGSADGVDRATEV